MNSLSLLLYVADIAGNARVFLGISTMLCGFGFLGLAITGGILKDMGSSESGAQMHRWLKPTMAIGILCGAILVVLPRPDTVMRIAASEFAEDILNTETGREVTGEAGELAVDSLRLLRQWVSDQLEDAASE